MMKVTLDTNCIIDLEEDRKTAPYTSVLTSMHKNQKINLRVVAISASERQLGGKYTSNFAEFKERIAAVGLGHVGILKPIFYWGITFWNWSLWANDEMVTLELQIHEILFPEIDFNYHKFCDKRGIDSNSGEIDRRWRNAKCDVLALWSHIYHKGGIFITSDSNFHKKTKKPALIALGAGDIVKPKDAVEKLKGEMDERISDA